MFWLIYKIIMGAFFVIMPIMFAKMFKDFGWGIIEVLTFIFILFCSLVGIGLILSMPM